MRTQVTVTPTLDTNIYASGDRLGSLMTIDDSSGFIQKGKLYLLEHVLILDQAKQSVALDCLMFDGSPTIASADNAAIDITDAEMAKCAGYFQVVAASYVALANSSVVQALPNIVLRPDATGKIYALLVVRSGTPTYAAGSLVLQFKLREV